ncbi:unnamed protein product [Meloidogyne enterolobii]|uniref:Uncharacterized protein n=1 Tax=Meloidogyne enterolobii TaxID=390850 RepID=A0ACB0YL06_MELEN
MLMEEKWKISPIFRKIRPTNCPHTFPHLSLNSSDKSIEPLDLPICMSFSVLFLSGFY